MDMLKDKIAVVTGGGKGIGKSITLKLASAGAKVIVVQRTPLDDELSKHSQVFWTHADISKPESIEGIMKFVRDNFANLDIIVNNAGIMSETKLEELTLNEWQRTLTINTTFPLFMIKALLPLMNKDRGSIINIGSIEGISVNPDHTAYCTSKAALHGMTRSLAVDLGSRGIRCNAIAPGWIDTELNKNLLANSNSGDQYMKELLNLHPLGRTGKPADIANIVKFLASDDSSFMTGQIIVIDGGRTAKLPLPS